MRTFRQLPLQRDEAWNPTYRFYNLRTLSIGWGFPLNFPSLTRAARSRRPHCLNCGGTSKNCAWTFHHLKRTRPPHSLTHDRLSFLANHLRPFVHYRCNAFRMSPSADELDFLWGFHFAKSLGIISCFLLFVVYLGYGCWEKASLFLGPEWLSWATLTVSIFLFFLFMKGKIMIERTEELDSLHFFCGWRCWGRGCLPGPPNVLDSGPGWRLPVSGVLILSSWLMCYAIRRLPWLQICPMPILVIDCILVFFWPCWKVYELYCFVHFSVMTQFIFLLLMCYVTDFPLRIDLRCDWFLLPWDSLILIRVPEWGGAKFIRSVGFFSLYSIDAVMFLFLFYVYHLYFCWVLTWSFDYCLKYSRMLPHSVGTRLGPWSWIISRPCRVPFFPHSLMHFCFTKNPSSEMLMDFLCYFSLVFSLSFFHFLIILSFFFPPL